MFLLGLFLVPVRFLRFKLLSRSYQVLVKFQSSFCQVSLKLLSGFSSFFCQVPVRFLSVRFL
jgi:hypothetical protein